MSKKGLSFNEVVDLYNTGLGAYILYREPFYDKIKNKKRQWNLSNETAIIETANGIFYTNGNTIYKIIPFYNSISIKKIIRIIKKEEKRILKNM